MKTTLEKTLEAMLKENTGVHCLDSGGVNGRFWQRNQNKDCEAESPVTLEDDYFIVSLYHYLKGLLSFDYVTEKINGLIEKNGWHWVADVDFDDIESEIGGVENIGERFNTYNWNAPFSQDFIGQTFEIGGENYVLIQIHGGADIRGGYTDVKCFKVKTPYIGHVDIYGTVNGVDVDTLYNGTSLTDEDGNVITWDLESVEYDLNIMDMDY